MAKIKKIEYIDDGKKIHHDQYLYHCPGCKYEHAFALNTEGGHHSFNGDLNNPVVSPSLVHDFSPNHERRCHSYIKDGKIQFLSDCWHELKGQTVELPEIE